MSLLERIGNNRGTMSSALAKKLAGEVLAGGGGILNECFTLVHHEDKDVRATCAKIMEIVAGERPELVAGRLGGLTGVFLLPEPQTRWMILYVFGLCARLNPVAAKGVFPLMDDYVTAQSGTCLLGRAIDYLGFIGELSGRDAEKAVPYLAAAARIDRRLERRVLVSLEKLLRVCDAALERRILGIVSGFRSPDGTVASRMAEKILGRHAGLSASLRTS